MLWVAARHLRIDRTPLPDGAWPNDHSSPLLSGAPSISRWNTPQPVCRRPPSTAPTTQSTLTTSQQLASAVPSKYTCSRTSDAPSSPAVLEVREIRERMQVTRLT